MSELLRRHSVHRGLLGNGVAAHVARLHWKWLSELVRKVELNGVWRFLRIPEDAGFKVRGAGTMNNE